MNDERLSPPPANEHCEPFRISSFEVQFGMPVWITLEDQQNFQDLFEGIVKAPWNQPRHGVHWLAGCGSKPTWSAVDSLMMGKPVEPGAPITGEPTFDDSVYQLESAARTFVSDTERERVEKRRAHEASLAGNTKEDILDMMRDEFARITALCANHPDDYRLKEISGLCERAQITIGQKVPVIKQLDEAKYELEAAQQECHYASLTLTDKDEELGIMRRALEHIRTKAHCAAKAGPAAIPTLEDAWNEFDLLSVKAGEALAECARYNIIPE